MKSIAFFNNKGGVGKTTLLCNLAGYLAIKHKKKVLVIDADPQCNTTSYVFKDEMFYSYYFEDESFSVSSLFPPLIEGKGFVQNFDAVKTPFFCFDIIPGNPLLASYEDFLANEWRDVKAGEVRGIRSSLVFSDFLSKCSKYDYVLFDMGPSLGAINRAVLLACDYFVTPMSSDVFSVLALKNIGQSISNWRDRFQGGYKELDRTKRENLDYIHHDYSIRFIGYVEQQYISKSVGDQRRAVRAYDKILQMIPDKIVKEVVIPINGAIENNVDYKIGSIPNYYSLVPMSQTAHKPIFELTSEDGVVGAHYQKVREFEQLMRTIADRMIANMEVIK